jgi:hypothetical protein
MGIGLALALPGWAFWRLTRPMLGNAIGYDEQFFMWGGWSMLKGLAPYRDFIEFKPPMTFLTHAVALKFFGFHNERFRYLFFGLALTSILTFAGSLIKRGTDLVLTSALALAIVAFFVHPGYHEAFLADTESIGLSYYFLGAAFLIANTPHRKAAEIIGGFFMACCGLSKEPFIPCVVATWLSCYFVVYGAFSRRNALAYLKYTTIGVSVVFGALAVYMVPTGAMSAYLATVRGYLTMFRDPQKGYCVLLGTFRPTGRGAFADLPLQWARIRLDFFNVGTLGFLAPFFGASLIFIPRRSWALFGTTLLALASALYGITASHCYFSHYYLMAQSGLFFFLAVGLDCLGPRLAHGSGATRLWMHASVFFAIALPIWPRIESAPTTPVYHQPIAEPIPGVFDFVAKNSAPTDKIFTTGPPGLYVYTDRVAAVRESSIIDELVPAMPGETDAEKLRPLYDELVRSMPKIVILDPEHGPRKYRHLNAAIMPFLTEFKYTKVGEYFYVRP